MPTDVDAAAGVGLIEAVDPEIARLIQAEAERQANTLELIASENHVSKAVLAAVGSCLTNKYCEGYPGRRYYCGCAHYDDVETLAIERARQLFGCRFANVQPHSGANANAAVFFALLAPGDCFASITLSDGGHLTHGSPVNLSGRWFKPVHYPLVYDTAREDYGCIDYDDVRRVCLEHRPRLLMCGYSAYPRVIDFARFRAIADECGAVLLADIAHIAGLVATGQHPSPFPHCQVVTTTTHKTLRGPRGGLVLTNDADLAARIDRAVFPGIQGGPLMHVIAGKAVALAEALQPAFADYCRAVVRNAAALSARLMHRGYHLVSRGTDNHLMLMDLRPTCPDLTGQTAAGWLEQAGIIVNKNTVLRDERSPVQTSGLRLGTPAITTRGLGEEQMPVVADWIDAVLRGDGDAAVIEKVRAAVADLCAQYPMPG